MVKVTFWQNESLGLIGLTVKGHAGFAPRGEDIVCAAVSALAQTAVLGLEQQLGLTLDVQIGDGKLECILPIGLNVFTLERAQIVLKTIAVGLEAIAETHRDHVKVEYKIRHR
ncbi:MAG: ribosomal-processing cysteine protease Prp [Clostridia bacterium]|nr:ribosomal-processing cysteine protease Prp [Clostridia bacterium]